MAKYSLVNEAVRALLGRQDRLSELLDDLKQPLAAAELTRQLP